MKQYSIKIYDANGDITKDWYIWWSLRDSQTGKMVRQNNIKAGCNRFKNKAERYAYLRKVIMLMEFQLNQMINEKLKSLDEVKFDFSEQKIYSLKEAFDYFLEMRKPVVSDVSIRDYKSVYNIFSSFLEEHNVDVSNAQLITRKIVLTFLNQRLIDTSARTRNNNQVVLSVFWEFLKNEEIVGRNILEGIPKVKTKPKRHKIYTPEQFETIIVEVKKSNPQLALYIKFVAYLFVRPIENCRIYIENIDLKSRIIVYKSKTKEQKTKYIIDLIYDELVKMDLGKYPKEYSLFTPEGRPALWKGKDESKRQYFTDLFKELVKDNKELKKLGLTEDHDIYSFRHTGIITLYRNYRKTLSPFETKSKLMLITGHTSMGSLEKYLRDIDAELPEDYSKDF